MGFSESRWAGNLEATSADLVLALGHELKEGRLVILGESGQVEGFGVLEQALLELGGHLQGLMGKLGPLDKTGQLGKQEFV